MGGTLLRDVARSAFTLTKRTCSPRTEVGPEKKAIYFQKNYKKKHILTDFRPKKPQKKKKKEHILTNFVL